MEKILIIYSFTFSELIGIARVSTWNRARIQICFQIPWIVWVGNLDLYFYPLRSNKFMSFFCWFVFQNFVGINMLIIMIVTQRHCICIWPECRTKTHNDFWTRKKWCVRASFYVNSNTGRNMQRRKLPYSLAIMCILKKKKCLIGTEITFKLFSVVIQYTSIELWLCVVQRY